MKPLLMMDVDGVLNCIGDLGVSLVDFEAEFTALGRFVIRVPAGTSGRIARLSETFDVVWATTWEHAAHDEIGVRLGVSDRWPVVEWGRRRLGPTWKVLGIERFAGLRPLAWVDDELHRDARVWASDRCARGSATLLVHTRPNVGLTEEHTVRLLRWAATIR